MHPKIEDREIARCSVVALWDTGEAGLSQDSITRESVPRRASAQDVGPSCWHEWVFPPLEPSKWPSVQ